MSPCCGWITFEDECRVFEVCKPQQASKVLAADMRLNMALPCRISVYSESGVTKIGLIRPVKILESLSDDAEIGRVAAEVEALTIQRVEESK